MSAIALAVGATALSYLLNSVFVGALLGASRLRSGTPVLNRRLFIGLLVVFAFLDLYMVPAVVALDLTVKIGNPSAAAVFGSEFHVVEILGLGWLDVFLWSTQALVAAWVADRLSVGSARLRNDSNIPES